ncbi:MAG: gliding motility-associated C-terminal domain-containing protein [Bacteroidales bacterium]|nr:gliding motility-associated C-terminal domain-containing protein [Bacteroidales bacterium]
MKRNQILKIFACLIGLCVQVKAQTGLPDNIVTADCTTDAVEQPWDAQVLHSANDIHCYYVPIVGDIDGDGMVEIVACKAVTNDHYTSRLGIYRGSDLQQIGTISVSQRIYAGFAGPVAIVRYPDGNGGMQGAIILHCYDNKLRSYDIQGNLLATSDVNTPCEGVVSITDFNYDGWPEVYIGNVIYDAATLKRLCAGPVNGNMGRSYRNDASEVGHSAMPFAANVLGDSIPELICGNTIYSVHIASRTDITLNSVTELKTIAIPASIPQDGSVAVADFNLDGQLDVLVVIDGTPSNIADSSYIYAYDPVTEGIFFVHSHYARTIGFPLVGDIDGDSYIDMVYLDYHTQVSNSRITAITYIPATGLHPKWQATHGDRSGQTSMTLFDFNQDNIMEIVYRDENNLRIINGSGKSHKTGNDTIPFYNLYTKSMSAGTWKEYPVVADVNGDGAAEIVVCGKVGSGLGWVGGQLWVIGGIHPWAPARPVWNQYMYNVTNINKDLTVPIPLFDNATSFTDPGGVVRRPFNNFLQQATTLDQYGRPFSRMLNVSATTDTNMTYENSMFTYSFTFCNDGGQPLNNPFSITYYADSYQGAIIRTEEIYSTLMVNNCLTITTQFTNAELLAFPDLETIVVAVNDNGTGVAQTGGQQEECDTTDNFFYFPASPCNIPKDTVTADICVRESYSDENFDISPAETQTAGTFYHRKVYQVDDCDSVIVLKLQVHPEYDLHFTETIPEGTAYDNHGIFLHESLLEGGNRIDTAITHQSEYGCDSVIHVSIQVAVADIAIYLPNAITPSKSDGLNDVFSLPERIQNQIADFEIVVFNRWGEMVFYSTDKNFRWSGEYKGKTFYDNVYQYVIHYSNPYGKMFTTKGTITVL